MNEMTFGKTPAAMYLARTLIEINNPSLDRAIGRKITAVTTSVAELMRAYEEYAISPKTIANTLRLMREEITKELIVGTDPTDLALKLSKNIRIGAIKSAIRTVSVARRIERVMSSPDRYGKVQEVGSNGIASWKSYTYFDKQAKTEFEAGSVHVVPSLLGPTKSINRPWHPEADTITPELLVERSNRRCKRQGKPHMEGV
jgi:hypothetical protein